MHIPRPGPRPPTSAVRGNTAEVIAHRRQRAPDTSSDPEPPSLSDLEAGTTVVWTELPADLAPWIKLGLAYTVGEAVPAIALRITEDPTMYAEIVATPEQMLALCDSITNICGVIPPISSARGEAAHWIAG